MRTAQSFIIGAVFCASLGLVLPSATARTSPTGPGPRVPNATAQDPALASLLAKTAEYCRKLEASAFDFVCREEIRETIDPKLDAAQGAAPSEGGTSPFLGPSIVIRTIRKIKHTFVYDYQCVRAGQKIRETRTLLEKDGRKKNVPDAQLETSIVAWDSALFGPVGLFGELFQPTFDYAIAGREPVEGLEAVIVDAKPKPGAPPDQNLYGRAWIDPATGDILKIEWSESRVGNYDVFAQRGRRFGRTPRLTLRSEFSVEKNGLRFPTRFSVEEAYLKEPGKPFIRSTTDVVYKDFKFFTVTVEVR